MKSRYDTVKSILHTEKGTYQEPKGKYTFWVASSANKIEVARAVQDIYKVKVASVNTLVVPGKLRRVRYQLGKQPDWKKAIVTLAPGQKIDTA